MGDSEIYKIAERLLILQSHGRQLLAILYHSKSMIDGPESKSQLLLDASWLNSQSSEEILSFLGAPIKCLSDPQIQQLSKAILKKFPDNSQELSKFPNYQQFVTAHKGIYEQLLPHYKAFEKTLNFRDAAMEAIYDCNSLNLSAESTPELCKVFLDVFNIVVSIHFIINQIPERKVIVGLFSRAYHLIHGSNELNYLKIATLVSYDTEKPLNRLQELFAPVAALLTGIMTTYKNEMMAALTSADKLRKENLLQILNPPPALPLSPFLGDSKIKGIADGSALQQNCIFVALICPEEITAKPAFAEIFKMCLQSCHNIYVFRDIFMNSLPEIENLLKNLKNSKLKPTPNEQSIALSKSIHFHRERREYLKRQLHLTLQYIYDSPSIVPPKIFQILELLSLSKEEILWYFYQNDSRRATNKKKRSIDADIVINIYLHQQLLNVLRKESHSIREQTIELIQKEILGQFLDSLSSVKEGVKSCEFSLQLLEKLFSSFQMVDNLEHFRMNFLRFQAASSKVTKVPAAAAETFSLMFSRTLLITSLEFLIDKKASIEDCFFFRKDLLDSFSESLFNPELSRYVCGILSLIQSASNPTLSFPSSNANNSFCYFLGYPNMNKLRNNYEIPAIGKESVLICKWIIERATLKMCALIDEDFKGTVSFNKSLSRECSGQRRKGQESFNFSMSTGSDTSISLLQLHYMNILCSIKDFFSNFQITVFDSELDISVFIIESLITYVRAFMVSNSHSTEANNLGSVSSSNEQSTEFPERPSLLLNTLKNYVEMLVSLNIGRLNPFLIEQLLLEQLQDQVISKKNESIDSRAQKKERFWAVDANPSSVLNAYAKCYADSIHAFSFTSNYSTLFRTLLSRNLNSTSSDLLSNFLNEDFFNQSELNSLAALIPGRDLKMALDNATLDHVTMYIGQIKSSEFKNESPSSVTKFVENLKKQFKSLDEFTEKLIVLGTLLSYRGLYSEAIKKNFIKTSPLFYKSSMNAFKLSLLYSELLGQDLNLALNALGITRYDNEDDGFISEIGVDESILDVGLQNALKLHEKCSHDKPDLWGMLPCALSLAIFYLSLNTNSTYLNPIHDHMENNAHSIVEAIFILLSAGFGGKQRDLAVVEFVETSYQLLINLYQDKECSTIAPSTSSMILLVRKIATKLKVSNAKMDEIIPYSLIRILKYKLPKQKSVSANNQFKKEKVNAAEEIVENQ